MDWSGGDPAGYVFSKGGKSVDGTGAAAIFPESKTDVTDEYLKYAEEERKRQADAKKEKSNKFKLPIDYSGIQSNLGKVVDTDRAEHSKAIDDILQRDAQTTMYGNSGNADPNIFTHLKTGIEHDKMIRQALIQQSQAQESVIQKKMDKGEDAYDPQSWQQLVNAKFIPQAQRNEVLDKIQPLDKHDWTKPLKEVGMQTSTQTETIKNKDGVPITQSFSTTTPFHVANAAYNIAGDSSPDAYATKKKYLQDHPGETADEKNPNYIDWLKKQIPVYKNTRVSSTYKEGNVPQGAEKAGNNSYSDGKHTWSLSEVPGEQIDKSAYNYKDSGGQTADQIAKASTPGTTITTDKGIISIAKDGTHTIISPDPATVRKVDFEFNTQGDNKPLDFEIKNAIDAKTADKVSIPSGSLTPNFWTEKTINGKREWYLDASTTNKTIGQINGKPAMVQEQTHYLLPEKDVRGKVAAEYGAKTLSTVLQKMGKSSGIKDDNVQYSDGGLKIKVQRRSDGKTGTILQSDYNANTYKKL
jgi:hypothetical protein